MVTLTETWAEQQSRLEKELEALLASTPSEPGRGDGLSGLREELRDRDWLDGRGEDEGSEVCDV